MTTYVLDCETYIDYFLIAFRDIDTGQTFTTELYDGGLILPYLPQGTYITFNGNNYDMPLIRMAFAGATNAQLKAASDDIILHGLKPWNISDKYMSAEVNVDTIDIIEVAPGMASLKIYGGRLNSKRMQDLPIEPSASISVDDRKLLTEYCCNDLQTTLDLYNQLKPQIDLRVEMGAEYGIDLRSKSDAQIAEAVIRSEVEKIVGHRVYKPDFHPAYKFKYVAPSFIAFQSEGMKNLLRIVQDAEFGIEGGGSVVMPPILESMRLRIGKGVYRMGVGGLHSSESSISHIADDTYALTDRDVASYYPQLILNGKYYPTHLGESFLMVYQGIVDKRLKAKREGNKVVADALKIVVNGSFGKFGSKWSVLYSPNLLVQVTVTGQLALLMLIEAIEEVGIEVVSANTDGVVIKHRHDQLELLNSIVAAWEFVSGLTTEDTSYKALYSKDVNNYLAIKPDGTTKTKGAYANAGLQKNSTNAVCIEAVISYLVEKRPIVETITQCTDVRKFVTVRQVKGGAVYGQTFLGKAVRWYYANGSVQTINYRGNGNKVPRSEGSMPIMELPSTLPEDINYQWYIDEAFSILNDIGVMR